MQTSYHHTTFGQFGRELERLADIDGYVHTTAAAWMDAPYDWGTDAPDEGNDSPEELADKRRYISDACEELAEKSRIAIKEAESALQEWRAKNA